VETLIRNRMLAVAQIRAVSVPTSLARIVGCRGFPSLFGDIAAQYTVRQQMEDDC